MVSYFKADAEGKIWYLWSGYVRFSQKLLQEYNKVPEDERVDTDPIQLDEKILVK
jgi:hypothetical protein